MKGPVQSWISVSDRLPEDEGVVIVYSEDTFYQVTCAQFRRYEDDSYSFRNAAENIEHVTHWMPLPSPPKK